MTSPGGRIGTRGPGGEIVFTAMSEDNALSMFAPVASDSDTEISVSAATSSRTSITSAIVRLRQRDNCRATPLMPCCNGVLGSDK